jgi:hypothetical protein
MSIEKYAKFWERNICDFPEAALKEKMGADMGSIIDGLAELRKILKMIYSDYKVFEVDDDDVEQNYDNLMYTVRFLQSIGKVGSLKNDRNNKIYLHIDKSNFIFKHDKLSKKPPVFQYNALPKYGFSIKYYKDAVEATSFNLCDFFDVYYDNSNNLLPALCYLTNNIPILDYATDYVKSDTLFLIADYESIFLNKSTKRKDINPLDYRIMKTAGIYSRLWEQLVEVLTKLFDIKSNIYERYSRLHSTPTWEINFKNNKLVVLNAYVKADMIELSLKLTVDQINEALNLKENLLPYIYQNLENVKSKKSKFVELKIESQQEVDSILEILKNIF